MTVPNRRTLLAAGLGLLAGGCTANRPDPGPSGSPPKRVVALGFGKDADAVLGLGMVPVAMPRSVTSPSGIEPWTESALAGARPELLDVNAEVPLERIAALRPDLIVATGLYSLGRHHDKLSRIAPVLAYLDGPNTDPWEDTTHRVGRSLGRPAQAAALVDRVSATIEDTARRHPELRGRTFTFSSIPTAGPVITKSSTLDVLALSLSRFGLRLSPRTAALPPSATPGLSTVSRERLDLLDADLTILLELPAQQRRELDALPVFQNLGSVRRGACVFLPPSHGHGLAFPSALSLEFAARHIVPTLAAALR